MNETTKAAGTLIYDKHIPPGANESSSSMITVVQLPEKKFDFEAFTSVFSALAGLGMFIGGILVLTATALLVRSYDFYYTSSGILLIIGFSFWLFAAVMNWIPTFGAFHGSTKNPYLIWNFFASILACSAFILYITGACCWLSVYGTVRFAGEIIWIIAASIWCCSVLLRDMGVRWAHMITYRHKNQVLNETEKLEIAVYQSSTWCNTLATIGYMIASLLLLFGSVMYNSRGRNNVDSYTGRQFMITASIMWIIGASIAVGSSIPHCISRR